MKRSYPIEAGSVVRSRAGRDEGRYFLVLTVKNEFATVADGGLRGIERPKTKRLRHLFATGEIISDLRRRLEAGQPVENHELRKWLSPYRQKEA